MAKIENIIEICNDCKFCKIYRNIEKTEDTKVFTCEKEGVIFLGKYYNQHNCVIEPPENCPLPEYKGDEHIFRQ